MIQDLWIDDKGSIDVMMFMLVGRNRLKDQKINWIDKETFANGQIIRSDIDRQKEKQKQRIQG